MSEQQSNHKNHRNNRNNRNKKQGQRNQRANDKGPKDRKVPMRYQVQNSKKTASIEFKYNVDGATEKTKLSVYEDGSDESFLKTIKEFQNYIDEIWDDNNAAQTVYQNFRRCLAGSARDLWDQINVLEDEEVERDELTFDSHLKEVTSVILGEDALRNQKIYLKYTPKPEKMSVKQLVNCIKNINSYLPLMQPNGHPFSEEDLIAKVISKNIPAVWEKDLKMFKLHLKTRIKDILSELTVIEEQVKIYPKNNKNSNKKQLKNPCRLHGTHEWDECHQNPKNNKTNIEKDKTDRNKSDANNRTREHRRTEERHSTSSTHCSRSSSRSSESDTSDEYHCLENKENIQSTPSSEILIAIPDTATSRKYTTYLGLIDSGSSGSSGSLNSKNIVKSFPVQTARKKTKWETATRILETKGTTTIEKCRLPQFTKNRAVSSTFHLFDKRPTNKYDVILGRDLLQAIGMDIHYSTNQFVWDNISIDMVPSGYWTKDKVSSVAKTGMNAKKYN